MTTDLNNRRTLKYLRWVIIAAGTYFTLAFIAIAVSRLLYPGEIEWLEGQMMDHAMQIHLGKPVYAAPTLDHVAVLYTPLYYYATALALKLVGIGYFAGRIVTVLSTIGTCILLWRTIKRVSPNAIAWLAPVLYLAANPVLGYYFDIARVDSMFVFMLVAAAWCALTQEKRWSVIAVALLLAIAFYTKQQATLFSPAFGIWYLLRDRRQAVLFACSVTALILLGYLYLQWQTDGWFSYYAFGIPAAKRDTFSFHRASRYAPSFLVAHYSFLMLATILWLVGSRLKSYGERMGLVVMLLASSLFSSAMSVGNHGGYVNVYMPFVAFAALAFPSLVHALHERGILSPLVLHALLALQLLGMLYVLPIRGMIFIQPSRTREAIASLETLRRLPGDLYLPDHGFIYYLIGKRPLPHRLGVLDLGLVKDSTSERYMRQYDSLLASGAMPTMIVDSGRIEPITIPAHYVRTGSIGPLAPAIEWNFPIYPAMLYRHESTSTQQ